MALGPLSFGSHTVRLGRHLLRQGPHTPCGGHGAKAISLEGVLSQQSSRPPTCSHSDPGPQGKDLLGHFTGVPVDAPLRPLRLRRN